jgi:colanic acid biosynthesis protein WcaH
MLPHDRWLAVVRDAPLVSIDLIVCDQQSRTLLGLRTNEPARGTWFVPGGVIRKGERLADAFERISTAELGACLRFDQTSSLGIFEHHYDSNFAGAPDFGTHYVVLAYRHELAAALDFLPKEQHQSYRWLSAAEILADPNVHENSKAYFRDFPT